MSSDPASPDPASIDAAAALGRLEAFAGRLDRLGLDDFRQMALSPAAALDRSAARGVAEDAAAAAGLADLASDARRRVRAHMDRVYTSGGYHPTWVTLNWGLSTGPVEDRIASVAAVEDAALAAVVEGLAPPEAVDELGAPFELIAGAHPPRPGGDALPTLGEIRRHGPVAAAVMFLLIGFAIAGFVYAAWPLAILLIVLAAGAVAGAARRDPRA